VDQAELFRYVIQALEDLHLTYMVVGSFASGAYGEARLTQGIDIVIDPTVQHIDRLCAAFPPDEFYVSREAALAALRPGGQFNVIHPGSGNKIDFMIARADAWGREQLARRRRLLLLPDQEGFAARPEDVIIGKMIYYAEGGSEKHLRDVAGILKVTGAEVDRGYVARWADQLGLVPIWEAILRRIG
jgi:hypothetical protein